MKKKMTVPGLLVLILAAAILIFTVFPFLYMITTALKSSAEIYERPTTFLAKNPDFGIFWKLLAGVSESAFDFRKGFLNTLKVASMATLMSVSVSASGAYGISRFNFFGRTFISRSILTTQVMPGVVLLMPIYVLFSNYSLLNNHFGLSLAHITFIIPFCTWMLKGFFDTIPRSLDEQAAVDGCSKWGAFFRVVLPLVRPGLAATAIFSFILSWNEFLFANVFLTKYDKWVLSVGLTSFRGQYLIYWNELMASSVLVSLPILVIYIVLQKYLVSGMSAGAVKE